MKISKKLLVLAILFLMLNLVIATQYAVTKIGYEYTILHPSDTSIRFIGSDNSSDGIRVLRVKGDNTSNVRVYLELGTVYTTNMIRTFTAAVGLVNEEAYPVNITHINVSSADATYMKIYLHGNRTGDASNATMDPDAILMWNNGTVVNESTTTAWTLREGNNNTHDMCFNVSDRTNYSTNTSWDETAHVRYSVNDTIAVSNVSDIVWIQITLDIPETVDLFGTYTGTLWIHLESEAHDE
jgi:hypothetical protein